MMQRHLNICSQVAEYLVQQNAASLLQTPIEGTDENEDDVTVSAEGSSQYDKDDENDSKMHTR